MGRSQIITGGFPTEEEIAQRAYLIWESKGQPEGDGSDNWEEARLQLLAERDRPRGPLRWILWRLKSRAA